MPEPSHERLPLTEAEPGGAIDQAPGGRGYDTTRGAFFRKAGAVAGGGLLAGAIPAGIALAQGGPPQSDIDILNFALTLEYLESAFYAEAVSNGKLNGDTANFAKVVADHESQHVAALQKALGSMAVKKPHFDFKGTTSDQAKFQKTAVALEDTGVSAYEGQAGNIKTPAILAAAGSILPVEARHASWIRDIIGHGGDPVPAPDAFNPPKTKNEVLQIVKATGFIKA